MRKSRKAAINILESVSFKNTGSMGWRAIEMGICLVSVARIPPQKRESFRVFLQNPNIQGKDI